MPELPEVEGVARELRQRLNQRQIVRVVVTRPRLVAPQSVESFAECLRGASFVDVGRRGKHLLLHLDNAHTLVIHLRMAGRFLYVAPTAPLPKFIHARFELDNDRWLAFQDQRHFAIMRLAPTDSLHQLKELRDLAPEPLGPDFTRDYLRRTLAGTQRPIKEVLLDQTRVAGLGNIYAAEALFAVGIHPLTPANAIPKAKVDYLWQVIRILLESAIEAGSTIDVNPENITGQYFGAAFAEALLVYDREGEPCVRCETPIARIRQAQRSTYFCPKCQRPRAKTTRQARS
ncbi:MAG: bifunctional DNA-formamidopyrimidine glycosylase/DNA-(apurinic or apyrimidinic site) lyase [Chloracidobacterium sp.]|uniref:Formamidopyrimidine-DNA glycosylase n=1 Tax=Chloracidobacterium validum TaxID=2821543 RepID=A0ABX8BBM5_9BACT|nr:bifunctional DNA-formamidopyrimidine glycosylase/DNA-(apurinic or apyrimidinic site) lyase [Chloracidobacterium validum]QUW02475.1 bifunctional DNA-formamidopyrimidine glycosylase/DNA-(apurinic or apyrimidinic site) lyase [Chloracidobacterium validum]